MNDMFLKKLELYEINDKEVAEKVIMKFINHLWYLSKECAAFSIFDERLSIETRMKMAEKQKQPEKESQKRCYSSNNVFERFNEYFLKVQPNEWPNVEEYEKGKSIIHFLKVVNDTAERGVKLMQEYNDKFTTNEDQKQFILQVV
ncbi:hypothetical protein QTP88_010853 [Uroleucon formosanum]